MSTFALGKYENDAFVMQLFFFFMLPICTLLHANLLITLVLLNPDIPCLCKQCRSKISWLLKKPTDLDLHCLPSSM